MKQKLDDSFATTTLGKLEDLSKKIDEPINDGNENAIANNSGFSTSNSTNEKNLINNIEPNNPHQKKVFKGFFDSTSKIFSKTEIFLPVTKISVKQSPLLFKEEVALAQTIIKEEEIYLELLKLLFSHIVDGDPKILESFESFLNNVCEADLETLLYGFYLCSYGPEIEVNDEHKCQKCEKTRKVTKLNLVEMYEDTPVDLGPFEAVTKEFDLDLSNSGLPNTVFYFKFPTLKKTSERVFPVENNKDVLGDLFSMTISNYLVKVKIENEIFDDKESILNAVNTLPPQARKVVKNKIKDSFLKYGAKLVYKWKCEDKKCQNENTVRYMITNFFFREISESVS